MRLALAVGELETLLHRLLFRLQKGQLAHVKGEFEKLLVINGFVLGVNQFAVGRMTEDTMHLRRLPLSHTRDIVITKLDMNLDAAALLRQALLCLFDFFFFVQGTTVRVHS